jgi:methylmalonyl-CoA mutase
MGETGLTVDITKIDAEKGFFDEFERPTKEQWKAEATTALKGAPFDKVMYTSTYENLTIEPIYCVEDIEGLPHLKSMPGFQPFARNTKPEGFLGAPWKISQELTQAFPEKFNEEARLDIARGQTGLSIVLDRPTRTGKDPHEAQAGDVGKEGLSLATLGDFKRAFHELDSGTPYLQCYTGATALPVVAMLAAAMKSENRDITGLEACFGSDPLAELAVEGKLGVSVGTALDSMCQTIRWSIGNAPKLQTVFIQGHPYHNAGASSTEEIAFTLAAAAEYVRGMICRGLTIDEVAPRIRFGFSLGSNFFMEIAKLRAARVLWSQFVAAFGGSEDSQKMRIHGRTSAYNKTVFDPYVNMLRVTSEGFSGAVGGVDSMHVSPFDEPMRTPDRFSRRIARNVQIMLQEEARFTMPIDMGGGSYYIEKMTHETAVAAWGIFQGIEKDGGMLAAIRAGKIQAMTAQTAAKRAKNIETRQEVILGTNMYANLAEKKIEIPQIDREQIQKAREEEVAAYRRNGKFFSLEEQFATIGKSLSDVRGKSIDAAVEAILAGATLGDIFEILSDVEKDYPDAVPLTIHRSAAAIEALRKRMDEWIEKSGGRLQIFLANMGPIPQHKPRADFTIGFFEIAGFQMLNNGGFETADAAADAALASGAPVVVVCSTDATYPDYVPALAARIKSAKPEITLIVAGKQSAEAEKAFVDAGVDDFIHVRANCYELNKKLQKKYMR